MVDRAPVVRCAVLIAAIGAVAACSTTHTAPIPPGESSLAAFARVASVLQHPRCVNCHPGTDRPRWGDDGRFEEHRFNITAGAGVTTGPGTGPAGLPCSTCHGDKNYDPAGVPGSPHWALAPVSMGWVGLSAAEVCRSIKDRRSNGNRSVEQVVAHMLNDELVAWAFEPGVRPNGLPRQKPPLDREEFSAALRRWLVSGARCPEPTE